MEFPECWWTEVTIVQNFDFTTAPVVSQLSSSVHSHSVAGGVNGNFGSTLKQSRNGGTQSLKWTDYTEKSWKDESPLEEPLYPEAASYDVLDDEDFSFSGEDDMMER